MAFLDPDRNVTVVRIVYDGPPESGKTTSLRALASGLGREAVTPKEVDGRTLYFDWLDYTGGMFEGRPICCQLVTVPGQRLLGERRRRLIESADVVVFVGDTSAAGADRSLETLRELQGLLDRPLAAPVGIILQANKRDHADALALDDLRDRLGRAGARIGIIESIASAGVGIRETFILAVRLALDRVRVLARAGALPIGRPDIADPDALLAMLQASEHEPLRRDREALAPTTMQQAFDDLVAPLPLPPPPVVATIPTDSIAAIAVAEALAPLLETLAEVAAAAPPPPPRRAGPSPRAGVLPPRPPTADVPSGSIWPPIDGRIVLHDAAPAAMTPVRLGDGDWAAGLGDGWRVHSRQAARFAELEHGRAALIQWARLHATCQDLLSPRRCVVLADDGHQHWRLWQVVKAEPSLRAQVVLAEPASAVALIERIDDALTALADAVARAARTPCPLRCSLDTVGWTEHGPQYIGLMPGPDTAPGPAPDEAAVRRDALQSLLVNDLAAHHHDLRHALDALEARGERAATCAAIRAALSTDAP